MIKRKKVEVQEVKQPINKELLIFNAGHTVECVNLTDIVPNVIDNVVINIENGRHILHLPSDMGKDSFRRSLQGRMGIFSNDVLKMSKNTFVTTHYRKVTDGNAVYIVRLVDDLSPMHNTSEFVDGYIDGRPFTKMMDRSVGEGLINTKTKKESGTIHTILCDDIEFTDYTAIFANRDVEVEHTNYTSISSFSE